MNKKPVITICGKGGVGKTVVSALLSRVLIDDGVKPLLLIDADPAGGLISAIGEQHSGTLAGIRDKLISSARNGEKTNTEEIANQLDFMVFEALVEREKYAFLAMGHSSEKGCFCPANTLLRNAIDLISDSFSCVIIDAEAGIEQIKRDVTCSVNQVIVVVDGSRRSLDTLQLILDLIDRKDVSVIANRINVDEPVLLPIEIEPAGIITQDETIMKFDREGRTLWDISSENIALNQIRQIAKTLGLYYKV